MECERKSPLSEPLVMLVRDVDFITVGTGRDWRENIEPEPELARSEEDPSLNLRTVRTVRSISVHSISNNNISDSIHFQFVIDHQSY